MPRTLRRLILPCAVLVGSLGMGGCAYYGPYPDGYYYGYGAPAGYYGYYGAPAYVGGTTLALGFGGGDWHRDRDWHRGGWGWRR